MQRVRKYIVLCSFVPAMGMAQQAKPLQFSWSTNIVQKPITSSLALYRPLVVKPSVVEPIRYTLPKAAIFCRMEDAFYKRFNILFKVRMGTDDRYSN